MSEKIIKTIRTDEEAWHMARVEAAKRCMYMGDLITNLIRWGLTAHNVSCPNCEKDFELYPPDYIEGMVSYHQKKESEL